MYFNRYEAKLAAKASMRQAKPSYMMVMVVYLLLTTGLTNLVMTLIGVPWANAATYLQQGYMLQEIFEYVVLQQLDRVVIAGVAEFILNLFCTVMEFGLVSYTLRLARNEGPGTANLFDGFAKAGRVIWMSILISLFTLLWSLLFSLPGILLVGLMAVTKMEYAFAQILYLIYLTVVVILAVWVAYRYHLASYILLDDPTCTARQAIRRSKEAMVGHKGDAVVLDLSFLGWALLAGAIQAGLSMLGMGVVGLVAVNVFYLWLMPYILTTRANFYNHVVGLSGGPARPAGGYAGPEYDYHSSDGPAPF